MDLTQLRYKSNIAEYNNWLADLKRAFRGNPARFPNSGQKIILAAVTFDDKLKTTYNSALVAYPALETHWRKFKRWAKETVL